MNSRIILNKDKLNQIKFKVDFDNLKCYYLLKKVFDIMKKNKSLKIIKYNKKLQNRLNISINDYKEYTQIYSLIEIELKLDLNKYNNNDKFINISDNKKDYFHIYFDNSNEEIKRNYLEEDDEVKTIRIIIDYHVKSFKGLFKNCSCISSILFKKFYRNNITDMSYMFYGCYLLKELNLSNFITNNVTDMRFMFYDCSSLIELNLSNFITNNVIDMCGTFCGCNSLKELNLSNFVTNNVIDMNRTFSGCISIKELNLSNFNTNNVTDMSLMFSRCSSLKELNLSNFNTIKVTNMNEMFFGCSSLKEINFSYFNIRKGTQRKTMFSRCPDELKKKIKEQKKIRRI